MCIVVKGFVSKKNMNLWFFIKKAVNLRFTRFLLLIIISPFNSLIVLEGWDLRAWETYTHLQQDLLAVALRSSGVAMSVQSLMLPDQLFRCRPRLRPTATGLCMMVFQRLLCRVTWINHDIWRLTAARRYTCRPKSFDIAVHVVIDFVLPNAEELSQSFVLERLDAFSSLKDECTNLRFVVEDEYDKRLVQPEIGMETLLDPFLSGHRNCFIAFIDYAKALRKISHKELLQMLGKFDIFRY